MSQQIGVFVPEATDALFHFHLFKCYLTHTIQVYNDQDLFVSSQHDHKVACFQMPYPLDSAFESTVKYFVDHCDHVLILVSELHGNTVLFMSRNDHERISYFICGELNFNLARSPVHKFYDWFSTTVHFYKHVRPHLLASQLSPYTSKPKYFDALLGRKKPHRDLAYETIDHETNVVTYLGKITEFTQDDFSDQSKWRWESAGLQLDKQVSWTVEHVNYQGHVMSLSQIVPLEVYNETAYSLVTETNHDNHYNFYTEKTVKPILGQRLFIHLSGQNILKNLRAIGFKTFDCVIDESYDQEPNPVKRWNMALDQVRYLSTIPQQEVLEKIRPICEHNYGHMMRTDWYRQYFMPAFTSYFLQTPQT